MKRSRLLKQTRQSSKYSCGASSLQAVLSYRGKDLDESAGDPISGRPFAL